eukprot:6212371-Pleurochrysis_carterae.AAC.6
MHQRSRLCNCKWNLFMYMAILRFITHYVYVYSGRQVPVATVLESDAEANGGGRSSAGVRRVVARGRAPRRPCVVPCVEARMKFTQTVRNRDTNQRLPTRIQY